MSLTKLAPAFHPTWNAPRGVWCAVPGRPGSIRTGPKVTRRPDCSQVRRLARSTHAVAAAGQSRRSAAVSVSGAAARPPGAARAARLADAAAAAELAARRETDSGTGGWALPAAVPGAPARAGGGLAVSTAATIVATATRAATA